VNRSRTEQSREIRKNGSLHEAQEVQIIEPKEGQHGRQAKCQGETWVTSNLWLLIVNQWYRVETP
jgi:hypothetical protein